MIFLACFGLVRLVASFYVVHKQVSVASCCFTFLFLRMLFQVDSGCLNCSNCFLLCSMLFYLFF